MQTHRCSDAHACPNCELDALHRRISDGDIPTSLDRLFAWLNDKRTSEPDSSWATWVRTYPLQHPISSVLHSEPFTSSAFHKPRGFAGDAGTLDFIYAALLPEYHQIRPQLSSERDSVIHDYITTRRPSAHAVAGRCRFFSEMIDELAAGRAKGRKCRALSVAAGHFRESKLCAAIGRGEVGEVVVLDQDPNAIEEIRATCTGLNVTPIHSSIRMLLTGKHDLGMFDLIYAGGLFDYLSQGTAVGLLERFVEILTPGGTAIAVNF